MHTREFHSTEQFVGCRLGDMVKMLYGITDEQLEVAVEVHKQTGERLGKVLVNLQMISLAQLATCSVLLSANETTLFAHGFAERIRSSWSSHHVRLFAETLFCTSVALVVMLLANVRESGLFSLFFMATALSATFEPINPDSKRKTIVIDFFLVFVGVFFTYLTAGLLVEPSMFESAFRLPALEAGVHDGIFLWESGNANFGEIFLQNITTACFLFCLSFVFRTYAVLLTIASCAYVWAIILAALLNPNLHHEAPGFFEALEVGLLGFGPHFILETLAYVIIGLCGLCLSKYLLWYGFFTQLFIANTKWVLLGLGATVLLLLLATGLEVSWFEQFPYK
ncbi:MAG: hypothetical protein VYA34_02420 [Myxococcota bacterium]|nr:hypothetical protein [Myxococcota bacterium]